MAGLVGRPAVGYCLGANVGYYSKRINGSRSEAVGFALIVHLMREYLSWRNISNLS